jgi:hypothetical protein
VTGLEAVVALWRELWLKLSQRGLDQAKADPCYLLSRAVRRADLDRVWRVRGRDGAGALLE